MMLVIAFCWSVMLMFMMMLDNYRMIMFMMVLVWRVFIMVAVRRVMNLVVVMMLMDRNMMHMLGVCGSVRC